MKIVAYDNAKLTVLFPFEEIAPLEGASVPEIINSVETKYQFTKVPNLNLPREELNKTGLKFENGFMSTEEGVVSVIELAIFGDGVVVTSKTTEDSEKLWEELIQMMRDYHGFRDFTTVPTKRFISQIVVEFDSPLSKMMRSFSAISEIISARLSDIYESRVAVDFSRIDLEFDKVGEKSSLTVPKFTIERRQGIPFHNERYYCSAPMRTKDHIDVLENIEHELT